MSEQSCKNFEKLYRRNFELVKFAEKLVKNAQIDATMFKKIAQVVKINRNATKLRKNTELCLQNQEISIEGVHHRNNRFCISLSGYFVTPRKNRDR